MKRFFHFVGYSCVVALAGCLPLQGADSEGNRSQDKRAVTVLCPLLGKLGADWSERKTVQYLEPLARPPAFVHDEQPDSKAVTDFMQRKIGTLGCEAYARVHYGKKDLAINTGGHHLMIYRWEDQEALDQAWAAILEKAPFNQEELPQVGEAVCWTHHGLYQALSFRKGLYMVHIECGRNDLVYGLLELADAVAALVPKVEFKTDATPSSSATTR